MFIKGVRATFGHEYFKNSVYFKCISWLEEKLKWFYNELTLYKINYLGVEYRNIIKSYEFETRSSHCFHCTMTIWIQKIIYEFVNIILTELNLIVNIYWLLKINYKFISHELIIISSVNGPKNIFTEILKSLRVRLKSVSPPAAANRPELTCDLHQLIGFRKSRQVQIICDKQAGSAKPHLAANNCACLPILGNAHGGKECWGHCIIDCFHMQLQSSWLLEPWKWRRSEGLIRQQSATENVNVKVSLLITLDNHFFTHEHG